MTYGFAPPLVYLRHSVLVHCIENYASLETGVAYNGYAAENRFRLMKTTTYPTIAQPLAAPTECRTWQDLPFAVLERIKDNKCLIPNPPL